MNQQKVLGYIAIIIAVIISGISYMFRKVITETGSLEPIIISLFQLFIMAFLFGIYNIATKKSIKVSPKHLPLMILTGLMGTVIFYTITITAVAHVGANIPSLLFGLSPAFSLLINILFYKKSTNLLSWIAVFLSLGGLYVIMDLTWENLANTNFLGYAYCVGSVIVWVLYSFMAPRVAEDYEKSVVLFWNAVAGFLVSLPFIFIYPINWNLLEPHFTSVVSSIVILGVFNSAVTYFLILYAIERIGINMSNMSFNFMPLATLAAVFIAYGTPPTTNEITGGLIIIVSVFLLGYAESRLNKKM